MTKNSRENKQEKKATILVVEDEPVILRQLGLILEGEGYSTILAGDGEEGFEQYKKYKPDLVITDLHMQGSIVDGWGLLAMLKKEDPFIPVIILTAYGSRESFLKASKMGADHFLNKPFRFENLIEVIENTLSKSKVQRGLSYYKNLSDALDKENKMLKERLAKLSETGGGGSLDKELERNRAICGAVAHGLKGEFMHIGYSLKEIRDSANASQEILEESDMIERSLSYSSLLLQRFRNWLDMGSLQREPVEALELLRKTEELAKPRLPAIVQLQVEIAPNIKAPAILANSEQIMGVLLEFINNASGALRPKGGTIEVKLEERNGKVVFSVKDDGPGIPASLRKKILKEQVPSKSGLGLGLYLSNKVIAEFGGTLELKTAAGKGTTFTIVFPAIEDKKES